jgi:hypothetical protein
MFKVICSKLIILGFKFKLLGSLVIGFLSLPFAFR